MPKVENRVTVKLTQPIRELAKVAAKEQGVFMSKFITQAIVEKAEGMGIRLKGNK